MGICINPTGCKGGATVILTLVTPTGTVGTDQQQTITLSNGSLVQHTNSDGTNVYCCQWYYVDLLDLNPLRTGTWEVQTESGAAMIVLTPGTNVIRMCDELLGGCNNNATKYPCD